MFLDPTPATRFSPGIASDGKNVFLSWLGSPFTVNGLSALNIETGTQAWEWTFTGNDGESISAPAYSGGRVYVHRWGHSSSCGTTCNDKPRVFGINSGTGAQLFDKTHSGQWSSGGRPSADGDFAFVAGGYYGGLDMYNGASGNIQWFADLPQEYGWIPAVDNARAYVGFGGSLTMVDRVTGAQQTLLAPSRNGDYGTSPAVGGPNEVYVPLGNLITQFDPINKYPTWEYKSESGYSVNDGIAIGDSALYVNFSNALVAINRTSGSLLWDYVPATCNRSHPGLKLSPK